MKPPLTLALVTAGLVCQVPWILRDAWRDVRSAPLAWRLDALRADERERVARAFARFPAASGGDLGGLADALPALERHVPEDGELRLLTPDDVPLGLDADRFAALLYPRRVRLVAWPLGRPLAPLDPRPGLWVLRIGQPRPPDLPGAALVLAEGELFAFWHYPGAPR